MGIEVEEDIDPLDAFMAKEVDLSLVCDQI